MPDDPLQRLGLSLAIGLLVGIERGWRQRETPDGRRAAGVRTFALAGLLGGVAGLLAVQFGGWAFLGLALPFAAAFILFKLREQAEDGDFSATAVVAGLLVFALGSYAIVGDWRVAVAAAVAATGLLALKPVLHAWLKTLTWPELRGALGLLAMSFLVLPLLPDSDLGPYGAFNPHQLWLLTIAIAGVSFVAYAANRLLGSGNGALVSALAGALISSTIVTLHLARRERAEPRAALAYGGIALLAGMVMVARVGVIAATLAPPVALRLAGALSAFAVVSLLVGCAAVWRGNGALLAADAQTAPIRSPFELPAVLKFAGILALVMAAARTLPALLGSGGLLAVAAVSGLADVDALTVTASRMAAHGLDPAVAAAAILLAGLADTCSKAVITAFVGGPRFAAIFAGGSSLAVAAAAAAFALG